DDTVWYGTISKIDTDSNTNENNNNYDYYEYGMSQGEGSSSYPFYVEVEDPEGLMMGQHVYMEQDLGQGAARTGIWLMSGYLMQEDGDYYVWAEDGDRLEKRKVTVGEYDEMTDEYQILEGLSGSDRIAWPESDLKEGMHTTDDYSDVYPEDYQPPEDSDGGNEYYDGEENFESGEYYDGMEYPDDFNGEDYAVPEDGGEVFNGADVPGNEGGSYEEKPQIQTVQESMGQ
ncbi:MAG: efflux RND transporter periplasmic adaptor subunit, partial [Lachnospiraceae bacterium]|nr:efflux RND transporter periplasmic adaptor subunit [Lachnospiraceae bacterium]